MVDLFGCEILTLTERVGWVRKTLCSVADFFASLQLPRYHHTIPVGNIRRIATTETYAVLLNDTLGLSFHDRPSSRIIGQKSNSHCRG